jgi:hypothetical protein
MAINQLSAPPQGIRRPARNPNAGERTWENTSLGERASHRYGQALRLYDRGSAFYGRNSWWINPAMQAAWQNGGSELAAGMLAAVI